MSLTLRRCCCRPLHIAIVHCWSSLHRGLGPAWRAAWPTLQRELRTLPVRWTTAVDFEGWRSHRIMVKNWGQDVADHPRFQLDDGRLIDPWGRYAISFARPIEQCRPPDLVPPAAWANLNSLSNGVIPSLAIRTLDGWQPQTPNHPLTVYGDVLFPDQTQASRVGDTAIVCFGGGICRTWLWPNPGYVNSSGDFIRPPDPPLDPPCEVQPGLFGVNPEASTILNLRYWKTMAFPLNPSPAGQGFDDSLEFKPLAIDPIPRPGYAARVATATEGWATHDWGAFGDVGRIVGELKRIVAAMLARRDA